MKRNLSKATPLRCSGPHDVVLLEAVDSSESEVVGQDVRVLPQYRLFIREARELVSEGVGRCRLRTVREELCQVLALAIIPKASATARKSSAEPPLSG